MRMMSQAGGSAGWWVTRSYNALALVALTSRSQPAVTSTQLRPRACPRQKTFSTPQEAGLALALAAKNDNQQQMTALFGPIRRRHFLRQCEEDKRSFAGFASAYDRMNRLRRLENGTKSCWST